MANYMTGLVRRAKLQQGALDQQPFNDANAYKQALMAAAGEQVSAGLPGINSFLAGQGPLADSGARASLAARLAGQAYGGVQSGYARYLADALARRRAYQYQTALLKYQKSLQQTGLGGILGGIGGSIIGGPVGGAIGTKILGGGGQ